MAQLYGTSEARPHEVESSLMWISCLPLFLSLQLRSQTRLHPRLLSRTCRSASRPATLRKCPRSRPGWPWPSERPKPGVTVLRSSNKSPHASPKTPPDKHPSTLTRALITLQCALQLKYPQSLAQINENYCCACTQVLYTVIIVIIT